MLVSRIIDPVNSRDPLVRAASQLVADVARECREGAFEAEFADRALEHAIAEHCATRDLVGASAVRLTSLAREIFRFKTKMAWFGPDLSGAPQ